MATTRPAPLTKDSIFAAALEIIDAEGADALSMRRLATALGVKAMSLYHHVPNKQALLDGVVELSLRAQAPSSPPSPRWQDAVTEAVRGFRRALVAHPNVLPLMAAHPPTTPGATQVYIEGPLRFLVAQGFSDEDASQLFEAVFALSFGHALLSTNYPVVKAEGVPAVEFTEESFERTVRVLLDGYGAQGGVG